jgi:hypothetical protein
MTGKGFDKPRAGGSFHCRRIATHSHPRFDERSHHVLLSSVRSDRQGIKAARFVERLLTARGHEITVVDPIALRLPLLDRMYKEYAKGTAPGTLEELASCIAPPTRSLW